MCGIVARLDEPSSSSPTPSTSRALALLAARGPDGAATWRDGALQLGLARLAIVAPREPARVHERDGVAAVMNGELYEHRSLRAALGVEEGTSDQALVPALFLDSTAPPTAVRGARVAVRGPVTAAIADTRARTITLVRDRFGKRPLFVDVEPGAGVRAASEVKALVAMRAGPVRFSRTAVARFLARGILEDDTPLVAGVEAVAPGAAWVLHEGGRIERDVASPLAAAEPHARALDVGVLGDACARRLAGLVVPAAVLLSGGLDSSLIAALSRAHVGVAYTMRIRSSETSDESDKARAMADALGLEHRVVDVAPPTLADLAACAWRLETPDAFVGFGVAHAYATLARRLRDDGIRVVVTGEGGDELFLGYAWQRAQAAAQGGWPFPPDVDTAELSWAGAALALPRTSRALEVFLRARFGAPLGAREPLSLVNAAALGDDAARAARDDVRGARGADRRRLESLRVDLPMWPLRIADRMLLGHGVEPRAPFLDEDVVAAALAVPAREHEREGVDKPLLRALASAALPAGAPPLAPKQGFGAWSWPGAALTRAWAARLAAEGTVLASGAALRELARAVDDASALLAWRLVVLEVTARQLDAARGGSPWRP